jgi:hypothetical protein
MASDVMDALMGEDMERVIRLGEGKGRILADIILAVHFQAPVTAHSRWILRPAVLFLVYPWFGP